MPDPHMPDSNDFLAGMNSDSRKSPVRVAFVTRRTSAQVKARDDGGTVMVFPEALFRGAVAIELLLLVLVVFSLFWDAPLEELANPLLTPNPAKAPWYFLGLQELLHYFPPVVAGVLIPGLVVTALIAIPYFQINIEGEGLWSRNRASRLRMVRITLVLFTLFLASFHVWVALAPTLLMAGLMLYSATERHDAGRFHRWLASKPLSFWIMSWFLLSSAVLTLIGTFFRGPGWSFVMPWSGQI